jgi:hypothetical protein
VDAQWVRFFEWRAAGVAGEWLCFVSGGAGGIVWYLQWVRFFERKGGREISEWYSVAGS